MKKYKLLQDYDWPGGRVEAGVIKTDAMWREYFPKLEDIDFQTNIQWFEEIELTHDEKYELCEEQVVQLKCLRDYCFHNNDGVCLNVSPAILLRSEKATCFSFVIAEAEEDTEEETDDEDDVDDVSVSTPNKRGRDPKEAMGTGWSPHKTYDDDLPF